MKTSRSRHLRNPDESEIPRAWHQLDPWDELRPEEDAREEEPSELPIVLGPASPSRSVAPGPFSVGPADLIGYATNVRLAYCLDWRIPGPSE